MIINKKAELQLKYILKIILIEVCFILVLTSVFFLAYCIDNKTLSYEELIYDIRLSSLIIVSSFVTVGLAHSITILVEHNWNLSFVHNSIINLYCIGIYISINILVLILLIPPKYIIIIVLPFALALLQIFSHQVSHHFRK